MPGYLRCPNLAFVWLDFVFVLRVLPFLWSCRYSAPGLLGLSLLAVEGRALSGIAA